MLKVPLQVIIPPEELENLINNLLEVLKALRGKSKLHDHGVTGKDITEILDEEAEVHELETRS